MNDLAHLAFQSSNTFGRALIPELDRDFESYWMDPYVLDLIKKIECSKAMRRIRGKTQVISGRMNMHIRDRLIHTRELFSLVTHIGLILKLNIPYLQGGATSHDLGHVTFGHLGEKFIGERLGEKFRHERFVIFLLEMIERRGMGLNLSYEILQAIRNHSGENGKMVKKPGLNLEDYVIMYSDKIINTFSDYNDMKRRNQEIVKVPDEFFRLGSNQTERLDACVKALCFESVMEKTISFEKSEEAIMFNVTKEFMYEEVYPTLNAKGLTNILTEVYEYFERYFKNPRAAALALALMAESETLDLFDLLRGYKDNLVSSTLSNTSQFSISEFLPKIEAWSELDFNNPDKFLDKNNFGKVHKADCFAR